MLRIHVDCFQTDTCQLAIKWRRRPTVVDYSQPFAVLIGFEDNGVVPYGVPSVPGDVISSMKSLEVENPLTTDGSSCMSSLMTMILGLPRMIEFTTTFPIF